VRAHDRCAEGVATSEVRTTLGARQAELVRAAVEGGALPPGFDVERVRLLAETLLRKRRRAVARTWPALRRCLSASFESRFDAFAGANPLREPHAVADGLAFARWLGDGELDDAARTELVTARARWVVGASGIRPRRLPFVGCAPLRGAVRLLVVIRVPSVQAWTIAVPGFAHVGRQEQGQIRTQSMRDPGGLASRVARKGDER